MRFKQLGFIGLLGLGLVGCDKTTKTPTQTTAIKARDPVIAIALGGGGAKGFAHIGGLKVLESHGITPKIVTGT
ncbi:patatin-like phospholipase family protein, partial [Acinetobacter guillouiae]|uniref:patatin-like phospholipase family protein n=1 Tax=Acinetobacter guillouiae TaxID=106649 RepID=UPI003AF8F5AA